MTPFTLKFVSGKYQGGEFAVPADGELIFGRTAEADVMLVEELVSRRHARLRSRAGALELADLGSTNGTFVNGEKIDSRPVGAGDRILIGTSVILLAPAPVDAQARHLSEKTLTGVPAQALLDQLAHKP